MSIETVECSGGHLATIDESLPFPQACEECGTELPDPAPIRPLSDDEIAGRVTEVFHYLDNRKRRAVAELFPDCERYYFDEWMDRKPVDFWGHLDPKHRTRLVTLAHEFYKPGGDR